MYSRALKLFKPSVNNSLFLGNLLGSGARTPRFKPVLLTTFSLFGAAYLAYDFYDQPTQNEPIKSRLIYIPADKIFNNIIKFNPEELSKRELTVRNRLIYRADKNHPLDGDDWIYVMTTDRKIFIEHPKRREINHTSLSAGFDILSAGEMKIKQGALYELNENSGHYRPKERVINTQKRLEELGVTFHPDYQCKTFETRPMIQSR